MATCGALVNVEQMGVLAVEPGHWTGKSSRRVDCLACLSTSPAEAEARHAARPPRKYASCPDRCQCLAHRGERIDDA
jgi:hypothetical protein